MRIIMKMIFKKSTRDFIRDAMECFYGILADKKDDVTGYYDEDLKYIIKLQSWLK